MKPDIYPTLKPLLLLLLAILTLTGCAGLNDNSSLNEKYTCISKGWPHNRSDLRPDPALHFGELGNGFRYVILHNEEPKDRVGLYLDIQAGSLEEKDSQRGYAHFLEHMLFNGSTHYPPGTLVEYFQSIGMAFGSDSNAHTNFDETVYNLLLPNGKEKNLSGGLVVMSDYARGALLLEDEVDRERGIILAEKRTRDSAGYRLYEKRMEFTLAGTRVPKRFPIGTVETINKADSASLRSFYDSWYRPENMILVVVGDVDPALAEKLIVRTFSPLTAPAAEPECFDFGRVDESVEQFMYVHEPEIGATELTISTDWNILPENDSIAAQHKEIKKYLASYLLQNRLKQLVRKVGSPLTSAQTYSGEFLQRFDYATMTASADGPAWKEGLDLLTTTLRQALELGFSSGELERAKKDIMADLEKEVQTASGRDSRKLAGNLIDAINRNDVFLSPKQEQELYGPVVASMTLKEVNRVFREMWSHGNRRIFVAGTAVPEEGATAEESIRKVYETARNKVITPWQENHVRAFPYLFPAETVPALSEEKHLESIGVDRYIFKDGMVLNVKKTDFQPNEVQVEVHFGGGQHTEKLPGLGMLAESVVNESGVGRLTKSELEEALAGKNITVAFKVGEESFLFKGNALSGELEELFQLIQTRLIDPAFRPESYSLRQEQYSQM